LPSLEEARRAALAASSSSAEAAKPTSGENGSARLMAAAWVQSTPLVPVLPAMSWFIRPTPMIEPISRVRGRGQEPEIRRAQKIP
jgi:hypothetical protein